MNIEIDNSSGFCFGVTNTIKKAEEILSNKSQLYCLGDIVHNSIEIERLKTLGLVLIDNKTFNTLKNTDVLIRAHGEPLETYRFAKKNNIKIIDATCPVVLALQKKIRETYISNPNSQIVIYGKKGHAEVKGLVGQTGNTAIVIETSEDVDRIDFNKDIFFFSQTTQSLQIFNQLIKLIKSKSKNVYIHNSICHQVTKRFEILERFVLKKDLIIFVSGEKSSNGKMLYEFCYKYNPNSKLITNINQIEKKWFENIDNIGVCGATSTPKWYLFKVKEYILNLK